MEIVLVYLCVRIKFTLELFNDKVNVHCLFFICNLELHETCYSESQHKNSLEDLRKSVSGSVYMQIMLQEEEAEEYSKIVKLKQRISGMEFTIKGLTERLGHCDEALVALKQIKTGVKQEKK